VTGPLKAAPCITRHRHRTSGSPRPRGHLAGSPEHHGVAARPAEVLFSG